MEGTPATAPSTQATFFVPIGVHGRRPTPMPAPTSLWPRRSPEGEVLLSSTSAGSSCGRPTRGRSAAALGRAAVMVYLRWLLEGRLRCWRKAWQVRVQGLGVGVGVGVGAGIGCGWKEARISNNQTHRVPRRFTHCGSSTRRAPRTTPPWCVCAPCREGGAQVEHALARRPPSPSSPSSQPAAHRQDHAAAAACHRPQHCPLDHWHLTYRSQERGLCGNASWHLGNSWRRGRRGAPVALLGAAHYG